jgi:hypothetical protein
MSEKELEEYVNLTLEDYKDQEKFWDYYRANKIIKYNYTESIIKDLSSTLDKPNLVEPSLFETEIDHDEADEPYVESIIQSDFKSQNSLKNYDNIPDSLKNILGNVIQELSHFKERLNKYEIKYNKKEMKDHKERLN